jgi:predicted metal-dependent peptidase
VLLHETGHIFGDHATLAKGLDVTPQTHKMWNVAADMAINDDLVAAGMTTIREGVLPEQIGMDDHLTPIEYYGALRRLVSDQQAQQANSQQGSQGQQGDQPDDQSQDGDSSGNGADSNDGGSGDGDETPFKGCGSVSGGEAAPVEVGPDDDLDGTAPASTAQQVQAARRRTAVLIADHRQKHPGSVPGGISRIVDDFFEPSQTKWQPILSLAVRRGIRMTSGLDVRTLRRRDRRSHNRTMPGSGKRVIRPGRMSHKVSIHLIRDTSGSMSDHDLKAVSREAEAIARTMRVTGKDFMVTDADAEAYGAREWKGKATMREGSGGGGTDMGGAIVSVLAERKKNPPNVLIVATDGYTPWPDMPPNADTKVIACIIADERTRQDLIDQVPGWITAIGVPPTR